MPRYSMSMKAYGKYLQEDERLRAAVKEYENERIDWKEVQLKFKLRAAKSCRLRYCMRRHASVMMYVLGKLLGGSNRSKDFQCSTSVENLRTRSLQVGESIEARH